MRLQRMAETPALEGEGPGSAAVDAATKKEPPPVAATPKPDAAPKVVGFEAKPATESVAKPDSAKAPEPKPEPVTATPAPKPAQPAADDVRDRIAALEQRQLRERRDSAIAYLTRVPSRLTDAQLRQLAPDIDAATSEGRAQLDKWREANINLFETPSLRPDQVVSDLEKRIITDKTDPALADRAQRLMKSVWRQR